MGGSDLFTGTLDILILHTVRSGPLHGYGIGRVLRERSDGVLDVEEGALYPALHRLEARGFLRSSWAPSETGRRAKFYRLTPDGQERLERLADQWKLFSGAVSEVLEAEG
jgi:PadR family transcriptional regulator PadR